LFLWQCLVIRQFPYGPRDAFAEQRPEFVKGRLSILDSVVENCGDKQLAISHPTFNGQGSSDGNRMVDIRRGVRVFAALVTMLSGGEGQGSKWFTQSTCVR